MTTLTKDQEAGVEAFFQFLLSDETVFVLSGGAGVGKTFLMGYIKSHLLDRYKATCKMLNMPEIFDKVYYTATTNKAAEVLEKSIQENVQTIHSFLGLKVQENNKTGKTELIPTGAFRVRKNCIIFIDESSMIDTALYDFILSAFKDSKIIFVGDHAQMAPVKEETSPVYQTVKPENFVFLGQPVRNAGNPALVELCSQLRNTVETGQFEPIQEVPGSIEYLDPAQMQAKLDQTFMHPNNEARILCYTNTRVQDFNAYVRELRGLPPLFTKGETLVVAQAYARGKMSLSVERQVEILEVDQTIHDHGYSHLTKSGNPLQYYKAEILPKSLFTTPMEVDLVVDQEDLTAVLKALSRRKLWAEYFQLKSNFLDLRNLEACTVYKSQGSTYDEVFIDLGNIGTSHDAKQVARMLFVGASRARHNVWLFGKLPGKYQRRMAA